jgi:hypothetical protein
MSSHGCRTALAAWILLTGVLAGTAGCSDAAGGTGTPRPAGATTASTAPFAGRLIDARDARGHRYREVPEKGAPQVAVEVQPAASGTGDGWDLRLTLHHFRFSPPARTGHPARRALAGRGAAELLLDGHPLALLHGPAYHLPVRLASRGTHQLTVCLHADDGTVWAVDGTPIQSTAALTVSEASLDAGRTGDAP